MPKKDPLKNKRIFVGFNGAGAAGIYSWTRVMKRRGFQIDFYGRYRQNFNMPVDVFVETSSNKIVAQFKQFFYFFQILFHYDIWHFNAMSTFFCYPINLLLLKLFGKKIICTFRGSEVRLDLDFLPPELFKKTSNWPKYWQNLVIKRSLYRRLVIWSRHLKMRFFCAIADRVIIIGPFLASSVSSFDQIIPYARPVGSKPKIIPKKAFIVLHAPTNAEIKGTEYVVKVFKKLSKKYPKSKFIITEKMDHKQLQEAIEKADIVVDQLLVGWYGGFAVEAMALGKVAIAYLSPQYYNFVSFSSEIPIVNSNPWNLERDLENLLCSPELCYRLANESFKFVKKYHSAEKIAGDYLNVYREVLK